MLWKKNYCIILSKYLDIYCYKLFCIFYQAYRVLYQKSDLLLTIGIFFYLRSSEGYSTKFLSFEIMSLKFYILAWFFIVQSLMIGLWPSTWLWMIFLVFLDLISWGFHVLYVRWLYYIKILLMSSLLWCQTKGNSFSNALLCLEILVLMLIQKVIY